MSDTVKLIIEIPKEAKQAFDKAEYNYLKGGYYDLGGIIGKAIQNGTPLDEVKADIKTYTIIKQNPIANRKVKADSIEVWKAEIIEREHIKELLDRTKAEIGKAQEPYQTSTAYDEGVRFGLMLAYQIVDRYMAESEETE